jgi:hypothetical protein
MTQDDCKLITEWLGEYWIDNTADVRKWLPSPNRTFTTPQDFFACFEKLVERGEWKDFEDFCWDKWNESAAQPGWTPTSWLLSRTESGHMRLCVLCAEWLKEKV